MPSELEIRRLETVYEGYRRSTAAQRRWAPENPGNGAIVRERRRKLYRMLEDAGYVPMGNRSILDVGCGDGRELASLRKWGAKTDDLVGIDLLPERVATARTQFPGIRFDQANAESLRFGDDSFDLVLLFTVFSSILDRDMQVNVAAEVRRVLKPEGAVMWYDFRYDNPRNPDVRGMTRSNVTRLFSDFKVRLESVTALPPLARRLGRSTPFVYPMLAAMPFLRTHYLGLLIKPQ